MADHDDKLVSLKAQPLNHPVAAEMLQLLSCVVAGGAVVRQLRQLDENDIDIFFLDRTHFRNAIGMAVTNGYQVEFSPSGKTDYIHDRAICTKVGEVPLDLIYVERHKSVSDVLSGFDLSVCQVGLVWSAGWRMVATPAAIADLFAGVVRITNNVWPTTEARLAKYVNFGFRPASPSAPLF